MRRILGIACIPAAIVGWVLLTNSQNRIGEAFFVAMIVLGALIMVADARARKAEMDAQRHQELLRSMRGRNPTTGARR